MREADAFEDAVFQSVAAAARKKVDLLNRSLSSYVLASMLAGAYIGIGIALWRPVTKAPHYGHVLLSTWASLFYLMAHAHVTSWLPLP